MQWLTVIWSMALSACITLALMHLSIWLKDRSNLALLLFSLAAISVAGVGAGELLMMRAQTPEELGLYMRWTHVPLFIAIVSVVAFVYVYFDTGRGWLALTIGALRLLILIINFFHKTMLIHCHFF